jgi:hypothetical protein
LLSPVTDKEGNMKAKVTHITEKLQVKAGLLLATSSIVDAIAAQGVVIQGPGRP